ncbi:MAG: DUF523 domain-containing protein [Thermodesulfobacteriota bacterium]
MSKIVLVSSCLLGIKSRYDGRDAKNSKLIKSLKGFVVIPVCPEQLGGLPTPRPAAEIQKHGGKAVLKGTAKVLDETGEDVTAQFIRGAKETFKIMRISKAGTIYLKDRSPSCGVTSIKRNGKTVRGQGVTAAYLKSKGIKAKGVR